MSKLSFTVMILILVTAFVAGDLCHAAGFGQQPPPQTTPIEVFQVYELPISVSTVELVKAGRAFELRCALTNNSNEKLLGFRYSLVAVDSDNRRHTLANRSEAFGLAPYQTRRRTIRNPLNLKLRPENRLVLMFEQIVGAESIWEVVKSKDAFDAYLTGDYSVVPRVLRVANHVDAPPGDAQPFRRNERY